MSMLDRVHATGADSDLAALNAVAVTVADLANDHDPVSAVRLRALARWQAAHDPYGLVERAHLLDAAALATLVDTDAGPGFVDAYFGELVEFVAELPW